MSQAFFMLNPHYSQKICYKAKLPATIGNARNCLSSKLGVQFHWIKIAVLPNSIGILAFLCEVS